MVSNISLAEVTKSTDPTLCVAKQMPVDLTEAYSRKLIKGRYKIIYIYHSHIADFCRV